MSEVRVMPLPKVHGTWIHDSSKYPDVVRIPMSDGKIVRYYIDVEMPHPCFEAAMKNLSNMKNTGDAATSTGQVTKVHRGHCTTEREDK